MITRRKLLQHSILMAALLFAGTAMAEGGTQAKSGETQIDFADSLLKAAGKRAEGKNPIAIRMGWNEVAMTNLINKEEWLELVWKRRSPGDRQVIE
jgi:hypothetical protein